MDGLSKNAYERRIARLENEKKELVRKLADSNRALQNFAHGPIADGDTTKTASDSSEIEIKDLKGQVERLTKKNQGKF